MPSGVNAGEVSTNRSGVASMHRAGREVGELDRPQLRAGAASTTPARPNRARRPARSRRRGRCCRARARCRRRGATTSTRPSWVATATCSPSGATTSSSTRPSWPAAMRRVPPSSVSSSASSPSASVTQIADLRLGTHARQPGADARGVGERAHRAVAVGQPLHGAADVDRAGATGRVDAERLGVGQRLVDRCDGRLPRDARTGQLHLDRDGLAVGGEVVDAVQPAGALVDQPRRAALEIAAEVAGVVAGVVAVPAQVAAVGGDRVDVAVALVVGQEHQPVADPHRVGELAVELGEEALELAAAVGVDPEPAARAAAVPLPRGGFAVHRAHQDGRAAGVPGQAADRAVGQPLGRAAVGRQRVGPRARPERLQRRRARPPPGRRPPSRARGSGSWFQYVSRVAGPPATGATYTSGLPSRRLPHATCEPSGESLGRDAGTRSEVSRSARPPSMPTRQTSSSATKTMWSPATEGKRR